jgi:phosphoribosylformylglycinamidine cyclo-ligase
VFHKSYATKYPESFDPGVPDELVYAGRYRVTDKPENSPLNVGKLVLSPTRTYAPVVLEILKGLRGNIDGMVHCSGGAQTKVLHFLSNDLHVVKDNLFPVPPLFRIIHDESGTDWKEMYKVFNMGHRMEIYIDEKFADRVIDIAFRFKIDARVIGRVSKSGQKQVTIKSEFGEFLYT